MREGKLWLEYIIWKANMLNKKSIKKEKSIKNHLSLLYEINGQEYMSCENKWRLLKREQAKTVYLKLTHYEARDAVPLLAFGTDSKAGWEVWKLHSDEREASV